MHISALLQAAACLGDGDVTVRSCAVQQKDALIHPRADSFDLVASKDMPKQPRLLSDSNSRYQHGKPGTVPGCKKISPAPLPANKPKASPKGVSHSCGKAKKEDKFKYSCRLCSDFQPTARCFNAERHIWVQHVRQQYPGQSKTLYEPFLAKHVVAPYIRTTTPDGAEVENREVAVLAALVASVTPAAESGPGGEDVHLVKQDSVRLGRKYRRNGKLNPDEVLPSRRLKPYEQSTAAGYTSDGMEQPRSKLRYQTSMPELSARAAVSRVSSEYNRGSDEIEAPWGHPSSAHRASSATSPTGHPFHRHSVPYPSHSRGPHWHHDSYQRQESLVWTPVPEVNNEADDDSMRPSIPLRRAMSVMEHRTRFVHTPDIPEEDDTPCSSSPPSLTKEVPSDTFTRNEHHLDMSTQGSTNDTAPTTPARAQSTTNPTTSQNVNSATASPEPAVVRRQSLTMISVPLARPASAFAMRPNDPPHHVWAQYGAPVPPRAYHMMS